MKLADFPSVQALSPSDKLNLVDELWVALAPALEEMQTTEEEKRILDQCWASYLRNPSSALTKEQFKQKIESLRR